jgi:hypothetical protein
MSNHLTRATFAGLLAIAICACSGITPSPTVEPMTASVAPASVTSPVPSPSTSSNPSQAASAVPSAETISRDQAAAIAIDTHGGRVLHVEAGTEDGRPTWEVELAGSDLGRIEVEVDQQSGAIADVERED